MNNEPVAYLMVERNDGNSYIQMGVPTRDEKISHQPYPLYTHPVKELTEEEIAKYVKEWELKELKENSSSTNYVQELAFVDGLTWLLRKAQEK